jgi:predicted negative regulator of RcsB-dependent stress response
MAALDLEEQEQLDALKAFWRQYGNFITWVLILALGGFAAWNGWNWWQREQSAKAAELFDELDRAAQAGDVDKAARVFADLKDRHPRAAYTPQAGLQLARLQADKAQWPAAAEALQWVAAQAGGEELRSLARLRLAGVQLQEGKHDDALKTLDGVAEPSFAGLAADRRGDVLLAMGRKDDARAAYDKAYKALEAASDYRRLVDAKLTALGAAPEAVAGVGAAAAAPAASAAGDKR